jgi:hypothetical protein
VLVSHQHRFIFVKTRKTAGTSIEIALSQFLGAEDVITWIDPQDEAIRLGLGYRGPQNQEIPLARCTLRQWGERLLRGKRAYYYNHMPAREMRVALGRETWRSYYRFCFERNPWDRALSLYYWRTQHADPRPPLCDFLRSVEREALSNYFLYTIKGRLAVDHLGRYEDLEAEMEKLRHTLGLPAEIRLPRAKSYSRSDRRPYQEMMDAESRELIARACAKEIALLGYTF